MDRRQQPGNRSTPPAQPADPSPAEERRASPVKDGRRSSDAAVAGEATPAGLEPPRRSAVPGPPVSEGAGPSEGAESNPSAAEAARPGESSSKGPRPESSAAADSASENPEDLESANQAERLRRRAAFLRDLAEAKELRARVSPRRTRVAKLREARRRATYRS